MDAEAISISELDGIVVVGGIGRQEAHTSGQMQPFHLILTQEEVEYMLNQAFRRRAPEPEQRSGGMRRFLRRDRG